MNKWENVLTYKQIADRYRVHKNTVRQWVEKGWLQPTRLAGRVYFTPEAVQKFEERRN